MSFSGYIKLYNRVSERFPILRKVRVLHSIHSHVGMTSAVSTAGPSYLKEALALNEWYRRLWSEADYRKLQRYRAAMRGRYHLG
jgi:hypothetical protein